ncbi:MAG: hypothetical protein HZB18_01965 [Chloroflexi bacterium]|nr:hypothetical protein [Chloroflexota bacterium]
MKLKNKAPIVLIIAVLILNACSFNAEPTPTATPASTSTPTATSTKTPTPTKTPPPTITPNLTATKRSEESNADIQHYFDEGYIDTTKGKFKKLDDFSEAWAQLNWYTTWTLEEAVGDFVFSGHFEWSSASKTPNPSGCGVVFAIRGTTKDDYKDYSIFLDRAQILYLRTEFGHGFRVGKTRGTTTVKLEDPLEADFTLIVYDHYSYVILNDEVIAEYTLPQSDLIEGALGVSILSGTNKDYGTRCEITNAQLWTPIK